MLMHETPRVPQWIVGRARGQPGRENLRLLHFVLEPFAVPGGHFQPPQNVNHDAILHTGDIQNCKPADQGDVTQAGFDTAFREKDIGSVDRVADIGTLKRVIDQGQVKAHTETFGEIVAGNQVGDGPIQKIRIRAADFMALELEGVERDEQLRNRKYEPWARFSPRIIRAVNGAQVTRQGWDAPRE